MKIATLAVVMFAYGAWALERQSTLARLEVRSETEAIATALGLAIGFALSRLRWVIPWKPCRLLRCAQELRQRLHDVRNE